MKKTFIIITGLSLCIHSISPCTGDGGDWSDYDKYGKRKYHDYSPTTNVTHSTVSQPSSTQAKLQIYTQSPPVHIISLKSRAEKAIISDRLSIFKRIMLHSDLKKYPDACQGLFKKIVTHWTHLSNGRAYIVRFEKEVTYRPDLTKEMLCKQLAYALSDRSFKKKLEKISRCSTFLSFASTMKIEGKSCSVLEYMQHRIKKSTKRLIDEQEHHNKSISSEDKKIILSLYNILEIPENPFNRHCDL